MGWRSSRVKLRTTSVVSPSRPIPGPIATASREPASSTIASRAFRASVRAEVSGSGSVIASSTRLATIGCWLTGVATVTSPTPLRIAAIAPSAAAPVLPSEPATRSRWP
jgi:hypothetical protein